jgi:hypothetical protein
VRRRGDSAQEEIRIAWKREIRKSSELLYSQTVPVAPSASSLLHAYGLKTAMPSKLSERVHLHGSRLAQLKDARD